MERREFDVVGVCEHGVVTGYVVRHELDGGVIGRHRRAFASSGVLPDSEPLLSAFAALRERRHFFITVFGHAGGIVRRPAEGSGAILAVRLGVSAGDADAARCKGTVSG